MRFSSHRLAALGLVLGVLFGFSAPAGAADKGQAGSHDGPGVASTPDKGSYNRPIAPERSANNPGVAIDSTGEADDVQRLIKLLEKEVHAPEISELTGDASKANKVGEVPGADSKAEKSAQNAEVPN